MKNLFASIARVTRPAASTPPIRLTQTFVETGDERCPIAGVWSRLAESDFATDDPEIARLAMWNLSSWRASFTSHNFAI